MEKSFKELSVNEQHRLAWKETFNRIACYALVGAALILCCLFVVALIWAFITAADYFKIVALPFWSSHPVLLSSIGALMLITLCLFLYKSFVFEEMMKENKPKVHSWRSNDGVAPKCHLVNAQYSDGTVVWSVKPELLEWDTQAKNPVIEYMIKV